ncbi:MAG: hypothetical protein LBU32_15570 [Clostridiales bacterium]|jgi:hypothetical protein|nr:hypothetical protein [Clostridiales bacterium]
MKMTFWDFCAPFYDHAEHTNTAYSKMLSLMRELTPHGASVFEAAAGTGSISLAVADKEKDALPISLEKCWRLQTKRLPREARATSRLAKKSVWRRRPGRDV